MTNPVTNNNNINNKNRINNNIIIINHTVPGVLGLTEQQSNTLLQKYEECVGSTLNNSVMAELMRFLENHSFEDLIDAIDRTAWAPRPSPAYLRAILRNYNSAAQNDRRGNNPALNYSQREYRNEVYDGDAFMEEARRLMEVKKNAL